MIYLTVQRPEKESGWEIKLQEQMGRAYVKWVLTHGSSNRQICEMFRQRKL